VSNDDAIATTRRVGAPREAIFAGISSGSITWAALQGRGPAGEHRQAHRVDHLRLRGAVPLQPGLYELPDPDFSDIEDALAPPAGCPEGAACVLHGAAVHHRRHEGHEDLRCRPGIDHIPGRKRSSPIFWGAEGRGPPTPPEPFRLG